MDMAGVKKTSTLFQLEVSAEMTLSSHLQIPPQNLLNWKFAIFSLLAFPPQPPNSLTWLSSSTFLLPLVRLSFSNVKCPPLFHHFNLLPSLAFAVCLSQFIVGPWSRWKMAPGWWSTSRRSNQRFLWMSFSSKARETADHKDCLLYMPQLDKWPVSVLFLKQ